MGVWPRRLPLRNCCGHSGHRRGRSSTQVDPLAGRTAGARQGGDSEYRPSLIRRSRCGGRRELAMPLPLPNLDTRRFDDLVAEMKALIPRNAPDWTNHNPSDPGITLIELFAFLTDMLLYRLNRVTEAQVRGFLRLLN